MKKISCILFTLLSIIFVFSSPVCADEENYRNFFLPEKDGISQPFVGDCMPYYEDGVYYIYYLKEGGDSFRHSIYLATTTDFLTYEEQDEPVLVSAEDSAAQDAWIGTGSVVKIDDTYYFFYTGHADDGQHEFNETVMLATSDNLRAFDKAAEWEMLPDESLGQKRDFRDPQAYYDEENGNLIFTITAAQDGVARILKYTVSKDLTEITYDGIIFTDPIGKVYNLECSDSFKIGDYYYLTYSAQDDTLWYARATEAYGPYEEPIRMDNQLYYAAKHIEDGENYYMAGWARRSQSETSTTSIDEWAGNLVVQEIHQKDDGSLVLAPVRAVEEQYRTESPMTVENGTVILETGEERVYQEIGSTSDSYMVKGSFAYTGTGSFGLAFEFKEGEENDKMIALNTDDQMMYLQFKGGKRRLAELDMDLAEGEIYNFTYIQENSVGVFYVDDLKAFTVRLYRVDNKPLRVFAENCGVTFENLKIFTR